MNWYAALAVRFGHELPMPGSSLLIACPSVSLNIVWLLGGSRLVTKLTMD
jgi:hypothetical protein